MKSISFAAYALIMIVMGSCTLYRDFPIEVLKTQEVVLPQRPVTLGLLYRNFKFPFDTLEHYYDNNGKLSHDKRNGNLNIDSLVVTSCLGGFASAILKQQDSLKVIHYPYEILPREEDSRLRLLPLQQVRKLAFTAKIDYLITLETLTYFFKQYKREDGAFEQACVVGAIWGIYDGETGEIAYRKSMSDTIYWNNSTKEKGSKAFPPRVPSLLMASSIFGENFAKKFQPEWITVRRSLIIPPVQDFKDAADLADQNNWGSASGLWMEYTPERYGRLAASACYNLAVASELQDQLDIALEWISKAIAHSSNYKQSEEYLMSMDYKKLLVSRVNNIERSEKRKTELK